LAGGITSGLYGVYSSSFPVILHHDEGESLSKLLGFTSVVAFVAGSIGIGFISDRFFVRRLKLLLIICLCVCIAGILLFTLTVPSPLPRIFPAPSHRMQFVAVITLSAAMGGVFPIAIELAAESLYPTEESTVVGAITSVNCFAGMWYLIAMDRIPNRDVNLPMLGGALAGLLLVCYVEETYLRRDADEGIACLDPDPESCH